MRDPLRELVAAQISQLQLPWQLTQPFRKCILLLLNSKRNLHDRRLHYFIGNLVVVLKIPQLEKRKERFISSYIKNIQIAFIESWCNETSFPSKFNRYSDLKVWISPIWWDLFPTCNVSLFLSKIPTYNSDFNSTFY